MHKYARKANTHAGTTAQRNTLRIAHVVKVCVCEKNKHVFLMYVIYLWVSSLVKHLRTIKGVMQVEYVMDNYNESGGRPIAFISNIRIFSDQTWSKVV